MFKSFAAAVIILTLALSACSRKEPAAGAQHASVVLRDGTQVSGTVIESSPTELKLAGDDKITRTIPTAQIKSVEYGDAPVDAAAPETGTPQAAKHGIAKPEPSRQAEAEMPARGVARPAETAITTKTYELPVGTVISVRNDETIDSAKAAEGQTFAAEVVRDVKDAAGDVVIPRGSNAQIVIRSASKGGRIRGASDLVLDLKSVAVDGRQYLLDTTDIRRTGKQGMGANKRTATYTGGGAALGAIIGAIAGQGKGAAIGAASGAGAGALTQILTKGSSIRVPVESVLTFKLDQPLHVVAAN